MHILLNGNVYSMQHDGFIFPHCGENANKGLLFQHFGLIA